MHTYKYTYTHTYTYTYTCTYKVTPAQPTLINDAKGQRPTMLKVTHHTSLYLTYPQDFRLVTHEFLYFHESTLQNAGIFLTTNIADQ